MSFRRTTDLLERWYSDINVCICIIVLDMLFNASWDAYIVRKWWSSSAQESCDMTLCVTGTS